MLHLLFTEVPRQKRRSAKFASNILHSPGPVHPDRTGARLLCPGPVPKAKTLHLVGLNKDALTCMSVVTESQ
jgi:hypothetical protein